MSDKLCPFCEAQIPEVALECPECDRRVAGAGSVGEFRRRLLAQELVFRKAMREGALRRAITSMGGRLRGRTVGLALTAVAAAGIILWAFFLPEESFLARWQWAAIILGFIALALFLGTLIDDLRLPAAEARTDPQRGLRAFLQALKLKRYAYAYGCLLPGDKNDRPRRRHAVQVIGTRSGKFAFANLGGFQAYWAPVFNPTSAESEMTFSEVKLVAREGEFALVTARLDAERKAGGWGGGLLGAALRGLMSKGKVLELTKLMRRVDGQWYLVNGELLSPEDDALEIFAALAEASDGELVDVSKTAGQV